MIIRMIVISLMVGFVAAGFVWFGIDLFQIVQAQRRAKTAPVEVVDEGEPGTPTE